MVTKATKALVIGVSIDTEEEWKEFGAVFTKYLREMENTEEADKFEKRDYEKDVKPYIPGVVPLSVYTYDNLKAEIKENPDIWCNSEEDLIRLLNFMDEGYTFAIYRAVF